MRKKKKKKKEKEVKATLTDRSACDDSAPPALTCSPLPLPLPPLRPPSGRQLRRLAGGAEALGPAGVSGEDGVTTRLTAGRGTGRVPVAIPAGHSAASSQR